MKFLGRVLLLLFSLGFLGASAAFGGFIYLINYYGSDLPDYSQLRNYEPPIVTRLYAGDGHLMAEFAQEKRVFVPVAFIPDLVKHAFIAAEDQNFYHHSGVDMKAVARALAKNLINKAHGINRRPEGASTITQQVAKNFFFTNEISYERKIKEAIIAYRINKTLGKERVLEIYLNQIYLGGGAHGVASASLYYFNKSLDELNIAEVAYLAALPKAPNNYHPVRNHKEALTRRNWAIGRMENEAYITKSQAELARLVLLEMKQDTSAHVDAPSFAEEVRRELSERYGEDSLYKGGLVVKTSVNPKLQKIAEESLRKGLMVYDKRHGWRGPVASIENIGDWRKNLSQIQPRTDMLKNWDLAIILKVDKETAKIGFADKDKQAGIIKLEDTKWARSYENEGNALGPVVSSLKQVLNVGDVIMVEPKSEEEVNSENKEMKINASISYLLRQIPTIQGALIALDPHTGRILAMQGGWNYRYGSSEFNRATQAKRQPGSAFKPFVYLAALDKGFTPATLILDAPFVLEDEISGPWKPTNYSNEFYGPTTLRMGVEKSRNLMTVRLADFLGMELISKYSDHFGITDHMQPLLANSLGSTETTLLRLTSAYGMIVNGGKKITPTFIDRVQDRYGHTIFKHDDRPCYVCGGMIKWEDQAVPDVPDSREQIADPRTTYQMVSIMDGVVQRGTGRRLKSLGRPLAGKTGTTNESRDAWFLGFTPDLVVGVFTGFDNPKSLGKRETGSSVAVPIFKDFMTHATADQSPTPFRKPEGIKNIRINAKTGVRAKPGDKNVIWESFVSGTEPGDDMYILNEVGISLLPSYGYNSYNNAQSQSNGEGGGSFIMSDPPSSGTQQPSSVSTGSGLY
ncbi:MAG: penicillin-binding protein 1A [Alphaproteobacteria bacterium]|nr:penicillin-binding protein 1A [Alphaproteobacteria bacterium]